MSEEENEVSEESVENVVDNAEAEKAPQPNPLFKTLFEIEEGIESQEEEKEEISRTPTTLNDVVEGLGEPAEESTEEVGTQEVEPTTDSSTGEEEPEKSEPKKKKLRKVIDPIVPEDIKPHINFEEEVKDDGDDEFSDTLLPEEKEVYDLAKYASKNMGETYKGYDNKFKDFFTKSKAFLEKKIDDDPHYNPRDDDDYSTFIERNRPDLTPSDAKKIEKRMWIDEAKMEARKELEPETKKLRKKLEAAQNQPVVNQAKSNFRSMAEDVVIPQEYRETFEKGGSEAIAKFAEDNPLEYGIMDKAAQTLLTYGDALTDIFLKTQDLDEGNPVHKELIDWVNKEQDGYIKSGQTEQDGKMFMRRERYYAMPEDRRAEYYTWSDDDLLKILALRSQEQVNQAITQQRSYLEKSGYIKQARNPEASPAPAKVQERQQVAPKPPVVNTTPRPGNNLNPSKVKAQNNAMLNVLGF